MTVYKIYNWSFEDTSDGLCLRGLSEQDERLEIYGIYDIDYTKRIVTTKTAIYKLFKGAYE
jgi:hypothetical protein